MLDGEILKGESEMEIITMSNGNQQLSFNVFDCGNAIIILNGVLEIIEDFAATFIKMCELGWELVKN